MNVLRNDGQENGFKSSGSDDEKCEPRLAVI